MPVSIAQETDLCWGACKRKYSSGYVHSSGLATAEMTDLDQSPPCSGWAQLRWPSGEEWNLCPSSSSCAWEGVATSKDVLSLGCLRVSKSFLVSKLAVGPIWCLQNMLSVSSDKIPFYLSDQIFTILLLVRKGALVVLAAWMLCCWFGWPVTLLLKSKKQSKSCSNSTQVWYTRCCVLPCSNITWPSLWTVTPSKVWNLPNPHETSGFSFILSWIVQKWKDHLQMQFSLYESLSTEKEILPGFSLSGLVLV